MNSFEKLPSRDEILQSLLQRRIVDIQGKIEENMSEKIISNLIMLDYKNSDPIKILIDSPGGDVYSTQHICSFINMLKSPVDGIVLRQCSSMAVDILFACRKRIATKSSRFLLHYTRVALRNICDSEMSESETKIITKKMSIARKEREVLYTKRMNKTPEEINEIFRFGEKHEFYYDSKEALELGIVDEIDENFKLFV